jgi:prevent-host-death family protein
VYTMAKRKMHHDVGIRDFRANLSRWLQAVRDGDEVVVTDHGVPVARLLGAGATSTLEQLIAEGKVRRPLRPRTPGRRPWITPKGSVSDLVAEQRR